MGEINAIAEASELKPLLNLRSNKSNFKLNWTKIQNFFTILMVKIKLVKIKDNYK